MKLVDFQFEHLELFDWREDEQKMYNVGSDFVRAITTAENKGESYTFMHDGRIVAIGGVVPLTKKTGYAFSLFSVHADKAHVATARAVSRMFHRLVEDLGLHRVTTYNLVEAERHHKWCEWLGFVREGVVPKFDDEGKDYVQYGLVINGH